MPEITLDDDFLSKRLQILALMLDPSDYRFRQSYWAHGMVKALELDSRYSVRPIGHQLIDALIQSPSYADLKDQTRKKR